MTLKKEKKNLYLSILVLSLLFIISACNNPRYNHLYKIKEFSSLNEFNSYLKSSNQEVNISKMDSKYILSGDLIIEPGISVDINNEVLEFDCSFDGQQGLYVYGTLNVFNKSIITTTDKNNCDYSFWYKKESQGRIEDSTIEYAWTGKGKSNEAGLFVESDYFEIFSSSIQYSKGNGIDFQGKNVIIHDSIFQNNGASGIEIFSSTKPAHFEVYNNTIKNNGLIKDRKDGCGVLIDNSEGRLYDNTLSENRYCGFESDCNKLESFCVIQIYNNNIYNNNHDGIFIHENSDVTVYSNVITSNRRGVSVDNYQTGRGTQLNLYDNMIRYNELGVEITENHDTYVQITNNSISGNKENIKILNSYNTTMSNNLVNGKLI